MERTIIAPEFKGGIWYRFFSAPTKKDETLVSILNEKIRYYKLYYPFLEKKQIIGKAYEELGIPHICGDLNRKELHKLFLKERKNYTLNDKYKKYPTLFIENKSRNKGLTKKPTIPTITQIKFNNVRTKVEKSNDDHVFDNLLSNVNPKREEGMIDNMSLKQIKSVRFNDGIEVHSVSPSQPLYKLKPLGRLFDEPSAVRAVDKPSYSKQELQERIVDSDSDFDADTGITSDAEDSEVEDLSQIKDYNKKTEITQNEKPEENSIPNTQNKNVYDCSEDDSLSIDHEISKEGNDLILSSKMITVVQGKWVRETKQIIENTYHTKDTIMSNIKSIKENADDERQEFAMVKNIEHILENIKSLCISNSQHDTSSVSISSTDRRESELNVKVKKEQFMVGNVKLGQDLTDIKITIQDKNEFKQRKTVCSKNINSKISLENDLSTHLIDEKLLTIDNNKLSYEHDINDTKGNMEENIEKRIRTKPIKLVDDLIDYINDWNSSNDGSLSFNSSRTLSIKPMHINDPEREKYIKAKEVLELKNVMGDLGSSEYILIEKESCLENEEDKFEESSFEENSRLDEEEQDSKDLSIKEKICSNKVGEDLEDLSHEEKICVEKEEEQFSLEGKCSLNKKKDSLKDFSLEEKSGSNEQNYSPSLSVNNKQNESSLLVVSNTSLNTMNHSKELIKTEPSTLSDEMENSRVDKIRYETHDYLPNLNMPFSRRDEMSEEKEFQINDTFTIIRSMVCNQSTSNPNELYSTFCSLITKPILVQSEDVEEVGDNKDNDNKLKLFEAEELDQKNNKMQSEYSVLKHELDGYHNRGIKAQETTKRDNEIYEDVNLKSSEENAENNTYADQKKHIDSGNKNSQICITDKKILCDESENIFNNIEKIEFHEDNIAVKSESNTTNFLSKVRMWSLHSEQYQENSAMNSQTSSVIASCNTDSLQMKVVDMEDIIKTPYDLNNESYYKNLSNEDSLTSKSNEEDNIFEELNNNSIDPETASSTRTVTPMKMEKNSEEVSTAYETDPETGKLVTNRFLHPILNSTPKKIEQFQEQQEFFSKKGPNENSLKGLSTNSSHTFKDNQCLDQETNNKQSWSISVIDESTTKSDSQCKNKNFPSELTSQVSLLITCGERNGTDTKNVLNINEKQEVIELNNNKNSKLPDFTESSLEKHSEVLSETVKSVFQCANSNNSISESIIENSENDSQRTFSREKNYKVVKSSTSPPVSADKQEDKFVAEIYTAKTDLNSIETSITSNIQNCNTFTVSETPDSYNDQERNSNESTYGSSTKSNEHYSIKKNVVLNLKAIEKTSMDSHSTDIIYDNSNIAEDYKFGQYNKTSTAGLANIKEGELKELGSEYIINENGLNNYDDLIVTSKIKGLSAVSESIINNNSKINEITSLSNEQVNNSNKTFNPKPSRTDLSHSPLNDENSSPNSVNNHLKNEGEKTDLGLEMHEIFSKKIVKDKQANVSHITFLIREPTSAEDRRPNAPESGYQQLINLSQSDNTSKIKQYRQNEKHNTDEILLPDNKIYTPEVTKNAHTNEALKLPNSNLLALDKNGSQFSIGVENSHFERSLFSGDNSENKYFRRSSTFLSLKRKLATINENDSSSDTSLSQDELLRKEIKTNVSSNIYSAVDGYSESPIPTDTSSIEMNLKRVNTDIRRKRVRMKKENLGRKSNTSSSEEEIKKTSFLKGKSFESSKPSISQPKFIGSNNKMKQSDKFDLQDNINIVDTQTQQNTKRSNTINPKDVSRNFSSLAHSFENKTSNVTFDHKTSNRSKEREYEHFSDSSSSIIFSSPNDEIKQQGKMTKTYDKPKTHFDKMTKKRQMEEDSPCFSEANITKKRSDKSHKSYPIYRKDDESNKENTHILHKGSRLNIEYYNSRLKQTNPEKQVTILHTKQVQNDERKYSDPNMKKNRKSSIVRLMEAAEGSQISNSPEVKGLLRRTYFMGNH